MSLVSCCPSGLINSDAEWQERLERLRTASSNRPLGSPSSIKAPIPPRSPAKTPTAVRFGAAEPTSVASDASARAPLRVNITGANGPTISSEQQSGARRVWNPFPGSEGVLHGAPAAAALASSPRAGPETHAVLSTSNAAAVAAAAGSALFSVPAPMAPQSPRQQVRSPRASHVAGLSSDAERSEALRSRLHDRRSRSASPPLAPMAGWRSPVSPRAETRSPRARTNSRDRRRSRDARDQNAVSPRSPRDSHKRSFTTAASEATAFPLAAEQKYSSRSPRHFGGSSFAVPPAAPSAPLSSPYLFTVRIQRAVNLPSERSVVGGDAVEPSTFLRYRLSLPAQTSLGSVSTPTAAATAVSVLHTAHKGLTGVVAEASSPVYNHEDTAVLPRDLFEQKQADFFGSGGEAPHSAKKRRSEDEVGSPELRSSLNAPHRSVPAWVLAIARAQLTIEAVAAAPTFSGRSVDDIGLGGAASPKRAALGSDTPLPLPWLSSSARSTAPQSGWVEKAVLGSACVDLAPLGRCHAS